MTVQPNICSIPEVDRLLMEHTNRPLKALYEALKDAANPGIELPMAIILDPRCGIERRAEEADGLQQLVGATPLILAIDQGRLDIAKALLAAGADPSATASNGRNSLIVAACKEEAGCLKAIEALISYGADINAVDEEGNTALHISTLCRNASLIELLERSGANLEAVDNEGQTSLHLAASWGGVGTMNIKTLLHLGADQEAVGNDGRTPLHCAALSYNASIDVIEAFRYNVAAFEASLTAVDKYGHTPLQMYGSRDSSDDSHIRALLTPN